MASDHPILARLDALVSHYRDDIARLTPELAHLRAERDIVMQYLSEFSTTLTKLIDARQASDDKAASEGKRADTAEAENARLKAQIAADEATLKGMLDAADAEVGKETGSGSGSAAPAPVVTTAPSGATVTVDAAAGTTTHVDDATGTATVVPHDGSAPTATDATGTAVPAPAAAVAEAVQASADAGVAVAAPAAPEGAAQPTI